MYKVGDRVFVTKEASKDSTNRECLGKVCTIEAMSENGYSIALKEAENHRKYVRVDYIVPESIYNSPLFRAMKEDE